MKGQYVSPDRDAAHRYSLGPGAYSFYVQYRDTPKAPSVSDIIAYNGLPIRHVFCVE